MLMQAMAALKSTPTAAVARSRLPQRCFTLACPFGSSSNYSFNITNTSTSNNNNSNSNPPAMCRRGVHAPLPHQPCRSPTSFKSYFGLRSPKLTVALFVSTVYLHTHKIVIDSRCRKRDQMDGNGRDGQGSELEAAAWSSGIAEVYCAEKFAGSGRALATPARLPATKSIGSPPPSSLRWGCCWFDGQSPPAACTTGDMLCPADVASGSQSAHCSWPLCSAAHGMSSADSDRLRLRSTSTKGVEIVTCTGTLRTGALVSVLATSRI